MYIFRILFLYFLFQVEEIEEVQPDGSIITRLITTKHIVDRVVEHAVSDELIAENGFTVLKDVDQEVPEADTGETLPSFFSDLNRWMILNDWISYFKISTFI